MGVVYSYFFNITTLSQTIENDEQYMTTRARMHLLSSEKQKITPSLVVASKSIEAVPKKDSKLLPPTSAHTDSSYGNFLSSITSEDTNTEGYEHSLLHTDDFLT